MRLIRKLWANPVCGGVMAGTFLASGVVVAFWAMSWLIHVLPWPTNS